MSEEFWISLGPFGYKEVGNNDVSSGQVNSIAVHPGDFNIIYVGASEGGIWKSTDGGSSWSPLTDLQLIRFVIAGDGRIIRRGTLDIGSIALDPQNPQIVYAGTGNVNNAIGSPSNGLGVFRSTDGGTTWRPLGEDLSNIDNKTMANSRVNRIGIFVLNQDSPSFVFAATNNGIFRFIDDGSDTWKLLSQGLPTTGEVIDLVLSSHPHNFKIFAAIPNNGVYRSTSYIGESWQKLSSGLPSGETIGRISLAFYQQNIVYCGLESLMPDQARYRLFKSINGGNDWAEILSEQIPMENQLNFNNKISVSPSNPNIIYLGQTNLWRSVDGGYSWQPITNCYGVSNSHCSGSNLHVDFHEIIFAPKGSFVPDASRVEVIFVGNDGGITKGTIDNRNFVTWSSITKGLAIGQCGEVGLNPSDPRDFACGFWHNGTLLMNSTGIPTPDLNAVRIGGGDGWKANIDSSLRPIRIYYHLNALSGGKMQRAKTYRHVWAIDPPTEVVWNDDAATSFILDPYRPGNLIRLQGGKLFRIRDCSSKPANTLNNPESWHLIDPPNKSGNSYSLAFKPRFELNEHPIYYLGTDSGQIWRGSPEVGWIKILELGSVLVKGIATDPNAPDRIVFTLSGANSPGRIKELELVDNNWRLLNIDANFNPELTIDRVGPIAIDPLDPNTVFVGTSLGIYRGRRINNNEWIWTRSSGIPNVVISNIESHDAFTCGHYSDGILYAATWGRGIFQYDRNRALSPVTAPVTLSITSTQLGEDGAPPILNVDASITVPGRSHEALTPTSIVIERRSQISIEVPSEINTEGGAVLSFISWRTSNIDSNESNKISFSMDTDIEATAYYSIKKS
jgi:hypothetical protein